MSGLLGLARRQATAHRAVPVALLLLVLLVSAVVTAWPRLLAGVDDRQVTHEIAATSPLSRDVVGVLPGGLPRLPAPPAGSTPFPPDVEENLGGLYAALEELRAAQPEPLRDLLGDPSFWLQSEPAEIEPPPDPLMGRQRLRLTVDPYLADRVTLVAGRWPEPHIPVDPYAELAEGREGLLTVEERLVLVNAAIAASEPLEVLLSAPAADVLEWEVGTERRITGNTVPALLTGTYEVTDPRADHWAHNLYSAQPYVVDDLNLGTSAEAAAYLAPSWDGGLPAGMPEHVRTFRTQMWFPTVVDALSADDVDAAAAQLTRFTAPQPLGEAGDLVPAAEVRFATELGEVLDRVRQQQAVTSTVLTVIASGPLGVTLAVFLLAARLLVSRRRSGLALLSARGGSGWQLRSVLALEGLVIGLPAAAAGALLAVLLLPGRTAPADLAVTGLVALVPAVVLAASTSPRGLRESRADLGTRPSRWRWVAEVVLLVVTAVALVLLGQRGVQPGAGETDVLLTGVPLLLAASTCVVVLRVYPLPVRALAGALRRRRGLTAFLGAARAVREPAGGLVPAVALVVGVSVAMFSAVLGSTISAGVQATAWQSVGADLRLSGPVLDEEKAAAIAAVPGVAGVATIGDAGTVSVAGERLDLAVADPAAVRAVQADGVGIDRLPADLSGGTGDAVPAVLSAEAVEALGAGVGDTLEAAVGDGVTLEVVGTVGRLAGAGTTGDVLVEAEAFAAAAGRAVLPRIALVDVADGEDPTAVLGRVREVEPVALAQNPAGDASGFLSSPMAGGMNAALGVAVVLSLVLVVVAVVMTQLMGAPVRARLLAVLRTLGLDRRRARGIVAWELGPLSAVSVLAGGVLGVLVPWVVLGGMDLRALTGGEEQPGLVVDPLVVGGVLGGVLLVTALAVLVSTVVSSRADVAGELRMGEET
ncbi:putative ABC transport system permease protein [Georgenia satyanarayanai]|uniref:Putative ABC transport system permease protein n=1 Tax=Georgenia satyanarayanai TaxID=860221 RepID=A0A2Y9C7Q5_9MICO|nr:FtsX-like permease family protein [Georgenia satyanarayanai]PYF96817.1 putative ABC transport system permease protein [Georgenia satyanarayanai]SSA46413.1 putative ABC transport system permease protein [Georgenia satyanarayanai]